MVALKPSEEIAILTNSIVAAHGKAAFNIGETAKICGMDRKAVGIEFDSCGITATKKRNSKCYTALAIAEYLTKRKVSPIQSFRKAKRVDLEHAKQAI